MRNTLFRCGIALCAFSLSSVAMAGDPITSGNDDPAIWGGQNVETCGWPTTVHVSNGGSWCTGTLIHPRVVAYAAHCGASNTRVRFGEDYNTARIVTPTSCQTNPGYTNPSNDWAYCVLPEDIDMPITPAVMGCELNNLTNGQDVALVGFGNNTGDSGSGTKRWGMSSMDSLNLNGNTVNVGGGGDPTVCSGDSGGPVFVQYGDGTWHALGIASVKFSGTCDAAQGQHSLMSGAMSWIEQQAGFDVTPCHDPDGTWNPGPLCTNFLTTGSNGTGGNWSDWCAASAGASGWSSTCGPGFDESEETNPPVVSITSPADGQSWVDAPQTIPIDIDATDDSGFISFVQIEIDGTLIPDQDLIAPWRFSNVEFPQGTYTIRAFAEDAWGNSAFSAPITIGVGEEPSGTDSGEESTTDPTTDTGEGEATTDATDSGDSEGEVGTDTGADGGTDTGLTTFGETSGGVNDDGGGDKGCACNGSDEGGPAGSLALLGLGLLGLGRRRRRG